MKRNVKAATVIFVVFILMFVLTSCFDKDEACEHQWSDWKVTEESTCDKEGVRTRTCTECLETETKKITVKGHDFNSENTCKECGFVLEFTKGLEYGEFTVGNSKYYGVTGIGAANSTDIVIPSSHAGNTVTAIAPQAFDGNDLITSLYVPDGITYIGLEAFDYCISLEKIYLSRDIRTIEARAFANCTALKSITLLSNLSYLGIGAFANTAYSNNPDNLEDGVLYIGTCLISANKDLTGEYHVKEGTSLIGNSAFAGCDNLTSVIFPDSYLYIQQSAFSSCTKLQKIEFSDSVYLASKAFANCTALTEIILPGFNTVATDAFIGTNIKKAVLYSIQDVYILDKEIVETLEIHYIPQYSYSANNALSGFSNLKKLTIPSIDLRFGALFSKTSFKNSVKVTQFTYQTLGGEEKYEYYIPKDLKDVTILAYGTLSGKNALLMNEFAFSGLTIDKLTITGSGKTKLHYYDTQFYKTNIRELNYDLNLNLVREISIDEQCKIEKLNYIGTINQMCEKGIPSFAANYESTPKVYLNNEVLKGVITLPEGIKSIAAGTFYGCDEITKIILNEDVTDISVSAFSRCSNLEEVILPSTLTEIPSYLFNECESLKTITIPNGVTSIGQSAFSGCSGLTSITIPNGVTSIGQSAFSGCTNLTSVIIPNSVISIDDYAFSGCIGIKSVALSSNITSISEGMFNNCSSLANISIPESVTSIDYRAFMGCTNLESLTIPNSVTRIGRDVFWECNSLESVNYLGTISQWCDISFSSFADSGRIFNLYFNGELVKDIIIPDGVKSISAKAFSQYNIRSVVIPDSVTSIGSSAFSNCTNLTNITIPNSVKSIGDSTFSGCIRLSSITIPDSVTSIGSSAFSNCTNLTNIIIPNSVKSIENLAFYNCESIEVVNYLGTISEWCQIIFDDGANPLLCGSELCINGEPISSNFVIPNDITAINNHAFEGCKNITSVIVGDHVTSIGESSFSGCSNLINVTIGDNVTSIGNWAFYKCDKLVNVTIGAKVKSIGDSTFSKCERLFEMCNRSSISIKKGGWGCLMNVYTDNNGAKKTFIDTNGFVFYEDGNICVLIGYIGNKTELTLPESCNGKTYTLYSNAFLGLDEITSITITKNVTYVARGISLAYGYDGSVQNIGWSNQHIAFENCSNLAEIIVEEDNTYYKSINGNLYTKDGKSLVRYAMGKKDENFTIPDGVTYIGSYAFRDCDSLMSIAIPNSVKSIGDSTFSGCIRLSSITIPDSVTSIGSTAFYYCTRLTIYCEAASQPSRWDADWNRSNRPVVWNCNNDDVATDGYIYMVVDGVCYGIKEGAVTVAMQPINITAVNIPSSITYKNAVYKVTTISTFAFSGCRDLTSVIIPDSVASIGACAFSDCDSLTSVTIPDSVTSIGHEAFEGCTDLASVVIPDSVTSINFSAFGDCTNLTIYCEAASKPSGWNSNWNNSNCPVVWGYKE